MKLIVSLYSEKEELLINIKEYFENHTNQIFIKSIIQYTKGNFIHNSRLCYKTNSLHITFYNIDIFNNIIELFDFDFLNQDLRSAVSIKFDTNDYMISIDKDFINFLCNFSEGVDFIFKWKKYTKTVSKICTKVSFVKENTKIISKKSIDTKYLSDLSSIIIKKDKEFGYLIKNGTIILSQNQKSLWNGSFMIDKTAIDRLSNHNISLIVTTY